MSTRTRRTRLAGWPAGSVDDGDSLAMAGLLALVYGLAWAIVATGTGESTGEETGTSSRSVLGPAGMLAATVLAMVGVGLSASGSRRTRAMGWGFQATATALLGVSLLASIRP